MAVPAPSNVNAQGFFLIVADQPGRNAGGFDLEQRKEPAVFVPSRIRVVQDGKQYPDTLEMVGGAMTSCRVRRSPTTDIPYLCSGFA